MLGSGGMGSVFKAVHRRMNRLVALKLLPSGNRSADSVQRFEREIQAVARLSHPNIVEAHDAGCHDGAYYFIMELIDGQDLARYVVENGPLPPKEAIGYVLQMARGLEYAHAAGVIHRDIKPSNLILDKAGTIKVLDLGVARFKASASFNDTAATSTLTSTGCVLGTVDYMAPEQALNTKLADHRADVYSLGCTLYFLLTGQPVYGGETTMERLLAHREKPIPSLRSVCPAVSKELDKVFQRMLAKKPDDRWQSMTDLIAALGRCCVDSANNDVRKHWQGVCLGLLGLGLLGTLSGLVVVMPKSLESGTTITEGKNHPHHGAPDLPRTTDEAQPPVLSVPASNDTPSEAMAKEPVTTGASADRRAAEWLLKVKGQVEVVTNGHRSSVRHLTDLPQTPFTVVVVKLTGNRSFTDDDLAILAPLTNVESLRLGGTTVSDAGLVHFQHYTKLTHLELNWTNVTGNGLSNFANARLRDFDASGLRNAKVGIRFLRSLGTLKGLSLNRSDVTTESLADLMAMTTLRMLFIADTHLPPQAMTELKTALPQCRIMN
jgi:serine/threonine protein kinase